MAKQFVKKTVEEIRTLLRALNPRKLGSSADPIVMERTSMILTGRIEKGKDGDVEKFIHKTTLSEEAKKANPNLTPTRYFRIMKTNEVQEISAPGALIRTGRRPLADNLFERQQPILFDTLVRLLQEDKEKGGNYHFEKMTPDPQGNPRLRLKSPIMGAFVTLSVPAHKRVDANGKVLSGATKNIATGKFNQAAPIEFTQDTFFLHEHELDSLESIAISRYRKLVEPMLFEEVVITKSSAGDERKEVNAGAQPEGHDEHETEIPGAPDPLDM